MAKKEKEHVIEIAPVAKQFIQVYVVGTSPIVLNKMSEKARQELLLPKRKTSADKRAGLKHNPLEEFQSSPYRFKTNEAATLLGVPAGAFKSAMCTAALDVPGGVKAQIGRLVHVEGDLVPLFGVPQIFMSVTRTAGINKTPDIRTRAIVPKWAAELTIGFVVPLLKKEMVVNLLAAAGIIAGVGDWRPEKGKGSYGQFHIASENDEELKEIIESGGREAQIAAMENPEFYDMETAELMAWFAAEAKRRGVSV